MRKFDFGFANEGNGGLFDLGAIHGTPGAIEAMQLAEISARDLLHRHHTGDWGDIHPEDVGLNEQSIENGTRILSAYKLPNTGKKLWVITEADRSVTTLLLPEEY